MTRLNRLTRHGGGAALALLVVVWAGLLPGVGRRGAAASVSPTTDTLRRAVAGLGAPQTDGRSVAVDGAGNVYLTGSTTSARFPTTAQAWQRRAGGGTCRDDFGATRCADAFVVKLSPRGRVLYATLLGGPGEDVGTGIAVDAAGAAYVTGATASPDFPTTSAGAPTPGDGFVAKLRPDGRTLAYSTYLAQGQAVAAAVDGTGHTYVAGQGGGGFVTKLGAGVGWSTRAPWGTCHPGPMTAPTRRESRSTAPAPPTSQGRTSRRAAPTPTIQSTEPTTPSRPSSTGGAPPTSTASAGPLSTRDARARLAQTMPARASRSTRPARPTWSGTPTTASRRSWAASIRPDATWPSSPPSGRKVV